MHIRRSLWVIALLAAGLCLALARPAPVGTLTITVSGKLGPVLSGIDTLGLNGTSAVLTLTASESLSPVRRQAGAASYSIPTGAVSFVDGPLSGASTAPSKIAAVRTSRAADVGELKTTIAVTALTGTIYLAPGSWTQAVLMHPLAFTPSPQNITAATTATGPGSKVQYTFLGNTVVLGITGAASATN